MKEARKKAKAEKERLEKQRQKLLAQQEEERRLIEEARIKKEEEERKLREAEEEERRKKEEAEKERLRQIEIEKKEKKEKEELIKKEKNAKKKKKKKRRKKDDWNDDREWTGERIVKCIHAQTSPMNWAVFKPSGSEIIPMAFGHGDLNDLRAALKNDQMQYGIMRLTFGEGRFRRSHWVFVCWSPDSMTRVDSQKLKKKRMNQRMRDVGHKGFMQKAIGPYGVEVLAEDYESVTLEDWILRVRKTVVVDGHDDLMNAEAFLKSLEAEKAHFAEMKAKKEEERRKKEELEKKMNDNESSSEEQVFDDKELAKNRKKRKQKVKGINDENNDDMNDLNKMNDDEKENEKLKKAEMDSLSVNMSEVNKGKKRKSSMDPTVLKARDVSSQLCYESITLIKKPETDLVWVLIEPRLRGQK